MTCEKCGYTFATTSDNSLKTAIDRLSMGDTLYFTRDQLIAQLFRSLRKKQYSLLVLTFIFIIIGIAVTVFFPAAIVNILEEQRIFIDFNVVFAVVAGIVGIFGIIIFAKAGFTCHTSLIAERIRNYNEKHPIEKLVTGNAFKGESDAPDKEIFDYAPERILIVQTNTMADMLILNRYPQENKTLVVSLNKYPKSAFDACQKFLENHPDIPIAVIHDCSRDGLRMKEMLLKSSAWNLKGREIQDIGLNPENVKKIKQPIWIPDVTDSGIRHVKIIEKGKPLKNIEAGYRIPLGIAPPRQLMNTVALAAATGLALMSKELLAEQASRSGNGSDAGGFG